MLIQPILMAFLLLWPDYPGILANPDNSTIKTRFNPPVGFHRKTQSPGSFASYLQGLTLKPEGSQVKYYNGQEKKNQVYAAVINMDIGQKDLQHCADAIIRLKAEYLYTRGEFDKISFPLTNGFEMKYAKWMAGFRLVVNGNQTWWKKTATPSNSYASFRAYLDIVFGYAGTISLSRSLHEKNIRDICIGDIFITGGSPGHAIIVVDLVENNSGKKLFLLAQSYMPAQDIHILQNYSHYGSGPWYAASPDGILETPEWRFHTSQLKTW